MTLSQIRAELRRLLGEEKTPAAAEEAARLVEEYRAAEGRWWLPTVTAEDVAAAEVAVDERAEERRKWARTLARIGRGGGAASTRIWNPGGREGERASVRENEQKTYLRRASPWR